MPDGTITFRTDLDNAKLEKELAKVTKKIETIEGRLARKTDTQSGIKLQLDEAKEAARQTENAIRSLEKENEQLGRIIGGTSGTAPTDPEKYMASLERQKQIATELKEQKKALEAQDKAAEKLGAKYARIADDVNAITTSLNILKEQAGEIRDEIDEGQTAAGKFGSAVGDIGKGFDKIQKRISKMISRVFLFSMLTSGLRSVRTWLGDVIKTNDEASAALARLKGALLTMAQPLVDVVIPAFTTLVNLLTAVIGKIAAFFAYLGGKSTKETAAAAKALNDETKALNDTGSAAKDAAKSLAGFDEINKLSAETSAGGSGSTTAEPDFSWSDGISEDLSRIADYVLLIAAGLALWKIGGMLPGALGTIATTLGGILITVGGLLLMWNGMADAWENGLDWGNMIQMVAGLAAAAVGLYIAFGSIGTGIVLVVGGIALLVTAFHDAMENGMNLQNTMLSIAGIFAAGLGISLLTGSWIPLLIAGIASVLLALVYFTGNGETLITGLKKICQGFLDFFTGLFSGNMNKAIEGLKTMFSGFGDVGKAVIDSLIDVFTMFLGWLNDATGGAVNKVISFINKMIMAVCEIWNSLAVALSFGIPGIGTFSLPRIQNVPQIPYLAQGAVIPPNREFMAVLGDQKHGNNIEAPEDLIRKIVREETAGGSDPEVAALLRELIEVVLGIKVGDEVIGRAAARYARKNSRAAGV